MNLSVEQVEEALHLTGATIVLDKTISGNERHAPIVLQQALKAIAERDGDTGQAGTHAYEMLATAAMQEAEVTSTLIPLIVAMTMAMGAERRMDWFDGDRKRSLTFMPAEIDNMLQSWDYTVNRDGMMSTVTIVRKDATAEIPTPLMNQREDVSDAKPQVVAQEGPDRPYWFVRRNGHLQKTCDLQDACETIRAVNRSRPMDTADLENRNCPRVDCPNSAQHQPPCVLCAKEVTSEIDKA